MQLRHLEKKPIPGPAHRVMMGCLASFSRDERGLVTVLGVFMMIAIALIGGLALDVMNRTAKATRLDMTTDAVAHAAIRARMTMSEEDAISIAREVARANMPPGRFGDVFLPQDIQFGTVNSSGVFTAQSGAEAAVRVTPRMSSERASAVPTFLLHLVGVDSWGLSSTAHFKLEGKPDQCLNNGFVGRSEVRFNSNNRFEEGICLHSNGIVWLRQNNLFENGSVVSMPDLNNLDVPGGSTSGNTGLDEALREATLDLSLLDDLPQTIAALENPFSENIPDYIISTNVVTLNAQQVNSGSFQKGYIHRVNCGQNGGNLNLPNTTLENIVLVTDCSIRLAGNGRIEESIIATTSTAGQSVRGSSGARVGRDNGCMPGAGTQIYTLGGMFFPAKLNVFSAQMIAAGSINFQANAGVSGYGAALIADVVDGRTNMEASACDAPMKYHVGGGDQRIRPFKGG